MEQVCCRVVQGCSHTLGLVHPGTDFLPYFQTATLNTAHVQMALAFFQGIPNFEATAVPDDDARITRLTTRLTIEGSTIQNDSGVGTCGNRIHRSAFYKDRGNVGALHQMLITGEVGLSFHLDQAVVINAKLAG